jgi:hypothetical protein
MIIVSSMPPSRLSHQHSNQKDPNHLTALSWRALGEVQEIVRRVPVRLSLEVFAPVVNGNHHAYRSVVDVHVILHPSHLNVADGVIFGAPPSRENGRSPADSLNSFVRIMVARAFRDAHHLFLFGHGKFLRRVLRKHRCLYARTPIARIVDGSAFIG